MYTAIVTDLLGDVLKNSGPYADIDEAMRAYSVPENQREVALKGGYKFMGPGFGPFVSIRPLTAN